MKKLVRKLQNRWPWHRFGSAASLARKAIREWERNGKPAPPPHVVKQQNLRHIARQYGLKTLIETGTYYGDMIDALKRDFEKIYSIELGDELHGQAVRRFAGQAHVELIHGDSGRVLQDLIARIKTPSLFWLDGHYSAGVTARGEKDTPIMEELSHIFSSPDIGHVIVVDDAHCFGVEPGYPSIEGLIEVVKAQRPNSSIVVVDNAIRIAPQ
jgi:hypothetical protein